MRRLHPLFETIDEIASPVFNVGPDVGANPIGPAPEERQAFVLPAWLKAKTGEGPIEKYMDHPMNFNKSMAMARIIRGLTGMFDAFDYAVVDIALGAFEMGKARTVKPVATETSANLI